MAADATPSGMFIGRLYGFSATGVMEAADTTPGIYTAIFGPHAAIQSNLAIDLPAQPQMKMKDLDPSGVGQMLQERRSLLRFHDENEVAHDDDEKQEMLDDHDDKSTNL